MYTTLASGELLSFFAVFRTSTFTPAGMTTSSRTLLHSNTTFLLGSCMPSLIHKGQTLWYLVSGPFSMSCAQASLYLSKLKLGGWPNSPLANLRSMASLAFWLFDGDGVGLLMTDCAATVQGARVKMGRDILLARKVRGGDGLSVEVVRATLRGGVSECVPVPRSSQLLQLFTRYFLANGLVCPAPRTLFAPRMDLVE